MKFKEKQPIQSIRQGVRVMKWVVLDFEKKERAKEVAELEAKKAELQEDLQESWQEVEKAQKQADKYQKRRLWNLQSRTGRRKQSRW